MTKSKAALLLAVVLVLYVGSYALLRQTHVEVWARDGRPYVIIPAAYRVAYYVYRPLMYIDGALTGMRFHIGPHRVDTP